MFDATDQERQDVILPYLAPIMSRFPSAQVEVPYERVGPKMAAAERSL